MDRLHVGPRGVVDAFDVGHAADYIQTRIPLHQSRVLAQDHADETAGTNRIRRQKLRRDPDGTAIA